ncbi:hypothetical protein [Candidatus Poriferisodalis sp.]|uniref:hypothetical protein n=1 Tax=Candidatus Poriferisodalis sp. TaxID=3101277 RepID=UPI003B5A7339
MSDDEQPQPPPYRPGPLVPWTPLVATVIAIGSIVAWGAAPTFGGDAYTDTVSAIYFIGAAITSCLALLCWRSWASDVGRVDYWRWREHKPEDPN